MSATALSTRINAFRPEIVVLGGTEVKFWKELLDEINSRCCERYYGAALLPVPKVDFWRPWEWTRD